MKKRSRHRSARNRAAGRTPAALLVLTLILLAAAPAGAVIIQRTITIDGTFTDWNPVPVTDPCPSDDIVCNPGQFSTDPSDNPTPTGRDLRTFAFTFDNDNLYMFVQRYASTTNNTDWWFYLDTNSNGFLETGEKVLHVDWSGSNRRIKRTLYDYAPVDTINGDSVTDPGTGQGDGYSMPGDIVDGVDLDSSNDPLIGGSEDGLSMETYLPWSLAKAGATGPFSLGFHISSSNGTNLPNNIIDDMNGPSGGGGGGSALIFSDPYITKTGPAKGASSFAVPFLITVGNNGPDTAYGVRVKDSCTDLSGDRPLASGESYTFAVAIPAAGTSYDAGDPAGDLPDLGAGVWDLGDVPAGALFTLTLYCTITVQTPISVTNTASIADFANPDIDVSASSNIATTVSPVEILPLPSLTVLKTSTVVWDPINGFDHPKRIPSACIRYTVQVQNTGPGSAETMEIRDTLPAGLTLYLGDPFALPADCGGVATPSGSPIHFEPGPNTIGTDPLTYTFNGLDDGGDDLALYASGQETVAAGIILVAGFDPQVTALRVLPQGTMRGSADNGGPSTGSTTNPFTFSYLVKLQ